jgi:two-component system, OmpR family, sensor kinase
LPIRWRLTLFNALAMGAILLALGLSLFFLVRDALLSGVEDAARSRAVAIARDVEEEPADDWFDEDDTEALTVTEVFAVVRDAEGRVLARSVESRGDDGASEPIWREALESGRPAGGTAELSRKGAAGYVYAVPVRPAYGPARVVETSKSYEPAEQAVGTLTNVLVGAALAAFVLSVGGAYLLAGAALRPVVAVTRAARGISEGDLGRRLPVARKGDEIGRLAATMNSLLDRLEAAFSRREEALARQRRFAADASHELRTPLTSISGHARMLDEWALEEDPERAKRSVGAIRHEAGRMRTLVESLLALARGDEGPPLEVGRHDLAAVAEEATQTARAAADGKVSVEYVPAGRRVEATFDRGRVLQAVSILLDNAVKYTPRGGGATVKVEERDGRTEIEVSDTGIGIPEGDLPLVFERFHRAEDSRASGGAGLGLAIARQIAEAHGGEIGAKSTPGEGSTFTLSLPREHPQNPNRTLNQR